MKFLFTLAFCVAILNSFSINPLWEKVSDKNLQVPGERKILPQQTSLVHLEDAQFRLLQLTIPTEASGQYILMALPVPDGSVKEFKVFEHTVMEQELADKYPTLKTYQAVSVDDPEVTAKLDYTEFGFHAMVFDHGNSYFIDPYSNINTGFYNCYYKKNYNRQTAQVSVCETKGSSQQTSGQQLRSSQNSSSNSVAIVPDGKRRTFRLALACTVEYSKAVAGPTPTKIAVLSAIVTSVNRVNGVYERELSIHMNLVAKEDTLIFLTTDSYSNSNGGAMLGQNQSVCDSRIGNANYDIGHVFSTGGGGVAGLGVVCSTGEKANGVTGSSDPVGDAFDIDYVVHEMGHQFGANHTFNAGTGSCSGNREGTVAYEVGSGTTIMAYAGICDYNDTQLHSDDYFHRASVNEIYNYISGTSCAVLTAATNTPPVVTDYSGTYNIPYKTSFEISATATSAHGNPLTYCWEEYDLGPQGNWDVANNTKAPIFRSFLAKTNGARVFPIWDSLIRNNIKYKGEVLPEVARDVKFRCTVRDIENGYGVYNAPNTDLLVKAVVTTTLFRVSSQATATTITGLTNQTITWDVAGTTAAPVSCSNVDIYLSLDSARTFPILLASNVANNGTALILIPDVVTANASARIKVKGHGNIFFDLNNGWIKINQAISQAVSFFSVSDTAVCEGGSITFTNASGGNPDSVRWTIPGGSITTSSSLTTVTPMFNTAGNYTITLMAYKAGIGAPLFFRTIVVKAKPTVLFAPAAPVTCAGDSTDVTANYNPGATCIWNTGSSNTTVRVAPSVNTYYSVSVTNNGCSESDSVLVKVNPVASVSFSQTICEGDSVVLGTQSFLLQGNYTAHFQTSLGCDSAVHLNLFVNPKKVTNLSQNICEGDSVQVGIQFFKSQGNYTLHFQTSLSCDSSVNLDLTVNPLPSTPVLDLQNDTLVVLAGTAISYKWYLNAVLQATTSVPSFKPTGGGVWTVTANTNGCESVASNAVVLTGIKVKRAEVLFSIVPNPNSGQFELKVTASKTGKYQLMLYNVGGQEIMKEEMILEAGVNTRKYSIEHLEKGMYFISLSGNDGVNTQSIIVQ